MGLMVTARKVAENADQVRYEFGLDRQFDRVLVIDKATWHPSPEDGRFDAATGAIAGRLKRLWRETGEFPDGALFAG